METDKMKKLLLAIIAIISISTMITLVYMNNKLNSIIESNQNNNQSDLIENNDDDDEKDGSEEFVKNLELFYNYVQIPNLTSSQDKKVVCSYYTNSCSETIFQKKSITGKDLSLEFKLFNTISYLMNNKNAAIKNGKIEEFSVDYGDSDEKFDYIKATDAISYLNILYNDNVSSDAYKEIKSMKNLISNDASGIYLGKVNGEDVYYVTNSEILTDRYQILDANSKYTEEDNKVILYTDIIYNTENGYDEGEDYIKSISKYDGSDKISFKNGDKIDYNHYKEYYTTYKITFEKNTDGSYTFISSEPVI